MTTTATTTATRGHYVFPETDYETCATADVFCGSRKWAVRDAQGRFTTRTHEAMVEVHYDDANEVAHSHTACPAIVGALTVAAGSPGWLCSTCIGVSTVDRRFYLVASTAGAKVCESCGTEKKVNQFGTLGNGGRSGECRECRKARRAATR